MISIKNKLALDKMRTAGRYLAELFELLAFQVKEDTTTLCLDSFVQEYLKKNGLISSTKGYRGYKHSSCISLNDEVVHGVPSQHKKLKTGDLVKIDICASWNGYCADMTRCFFVGEVDALVKKLVFTAQASLDAGIAQMHSGNYLTDISAAIQKEVEVADFGVVRDFAGHGIGKSMHEDPEILNYGNPGQGPRLREGMAFALEPMITQGSYQVYIDVDGWTVKTKDKSLAAHVEDTIIVTQNGPEVLTRLENEGR